MSDLNNTVMADRSDGILQPQRWSDRYSSDAGRVRYSRAYRQGGKRLFDIVIVIAGLPVILPVILVLALLVMRDGGAPFFGHRRVGRDGRTFLCWKLRSMVPDAEARLRDHLAQDPAARAEWDANFKLEKDPRITRLGHFLRRSSLDELPQIWNILKGEMSVVGPRPVTAAEIELYGVHVAEYQSLHPGLTGLWQVSGRNDLSYAERVKLDVSYARSSSLFLDTMIVLRTVRAVIQRTGR